MHWFWFSVCFIAWLQFSVLLTKASEITIKSDCVNVDSIWKFWHLDSLLKSIWVKLFDTYQFGVRLPIQNVNTQNTLTVFLSSKIGCFSAKCRWFFNSFCRLNVKKCVRDYFVLVVLQIPLKFIGEHFDFSRHLHNSRNSFKVMPNKFHSNWILIVIHRLIWLVSLNLVINKVEIIGTIHKHLFTLPSGYKSYIVRTDEPTNK